MSDFPFTAGQRVTLVSSTDPYTALRPGDTGTVTGVDASSMTVHVRWDSGSALSMLLAEGDVIRPLTEGKAAESPSVGDLCQAGEAKGRGESPPLEQWMAAIWGQLFGISPRTADVHVVKQLSDDTFESRADAIAGLLWDHWLGEPANPSLEQVREYVTDIGKTLAATTEESAE